MHRRLICISVIMYVLQIIGLTTVIHVLAPCVSIWILACVSAIGQYGLTGWFETELKGSAQVKS